MQAFYIYDVKDFFNYSAGDRDFTLKQIKPEFGKLANTQWTLHMKCVVLHEIGGWMEDPANHIERFPFGMSSRLVQFCNNGQTLTVGEHTTIHVMHVQRCSLKVLLMS